MKNITVTGIALAMLLLAGTPVLAENPVEPERLARISRRRYAERCKSRRAERFRSDGWSTQYPCPTQNTPGGAPKS